MSSANSSRAVHLPVYSLAFGGIGAGYAHLVNAAGAFAIPYPARIVAVQNYTDVDVMISYNGIDDHYPVRSGFIWDYSSDTATNAGGFYLPSNTIFYVKQLTGAAATLGGVYISVVVGEDI
jgi:hypothetical protein